MSDIQFNCPECRRNLEASREMVGTALVCPTCGKTIVIPEVVDNTLNNADTIPSTPHSNEDVSGINRDIPLDAFYPSMSDANRSHVNVIKNDVITNESSSQAGSHKDHMLRLCSWTRWIRAHSIRTAFIVLVLLALILWIFSALGEKQPGSIGILLSESSGKKTVSSIVVGWPAQVAGIRLGDQILAVGSSKWRLLDVAELSLPAVHNEFQVSAGCKVWVRYLSPGFDEATVNLRAKSLPQNVIVMNISNSTYSSEVLIPDEAIFSKSIISGQQFAVTNLLAGRFPRQPEFSPDQRRYADPLPENSKVNNSSSIHNSKADDQSKESYPLLDIESQAPRDLFPAISILSERLAAIAMVEYISLLGGQTLLGNRDRLNVYKNSTCWMKPQHVQGNVDRVILTIFDGFNVYGGANVKKLSWLVNTNSQAIEAETPLAQLFIDAQKNERNAERLAADHMMKLMRP